ncbi:protein N-terminal glutamine amidohydrolase isoform X2 [Planococcus citri]|uniref:protein N-terminal glutamine amidohydrolase isoform X2 n=1 Tax=Planococcus citri TaxID=170843 RepID=UPI0031F88FE5
MGRRCYRRYLLYRNASIHLATVISVDSFSEENVWQLCKQLVKQEKSGNECYCVFISNSKRAIHLWKQKCATEKNFVIWDYHVITVYGNRKHGYHVLDLDTRLSFPVPFKQYASEALKSEETIMPDYKRFFRVITAQEYLKHFSSDRRHMKVGDSWQKPPPNYAPIITDPKNPHKLDEFIDMTKGKGLGEVLNYDEFLKKFG